MRYWRNELHSGRKADDPFFPANAHIWREDEAGVVALCISEEGRQDLFVEVLPSHLEIYPSILQWIECAWALKRGGVEIDIFANDVRKLDLFTSAGYVFMKHSRNMRHYALDRVDLSYSLEPGFSVRTFTETHDFAGRIALLQNAFADPNYSERRLKGLLATPTYEPDWDLMVLSSDGMPASHCVGWRSPAKADSGSIEPVVTHSEYRRQGLAQVIVRECFQRMKAGGIKTVRIASVAEPAVGNFLYESLGPTSKQEVHRYRKAFQGTQIEAGLAGSSSV